MKDKKLEANLSMVASRVMAGLNMNGLKFLLPLWLGALTGVTVRCVFAAVAFWITSWFVKEAPVTRRQRIGLFCLGAFGLYGFMFCYLLGISKMTPVSSAIFNSMQPIWVFLISVFFLHEKATLMKVIGIALGALTGVTVRCVFAAVAFWITSWFVKEAPVTRRQRIGLFCLGAFGLYGFMFCYLLGISKMTPVSSAIFNSMQPIWVFLISVFFLHEKATLMKVIGIALGFGGALLCILTQGSDDLAHDAFTGNMLCMVSSLVFAVYLIVSKKLLEEVGVVTMMKYIFGGAAVTGLIVSSIIGWDAPLLTDALHGEWHWVPWAVLAFVLVFPTYLSYFLVPVGLKYLKTTVVAMYSYLILVVTTVVSLILGQDRFSWTQAVAIAMICISVYFVEVAEAKK